MIGKLVGGIKSDISSISEVIQNMEGYGDQIKGLKNNI